MAYSDYTIFVDESGDHGLKTIDPNYPVFVLAFCIFRKNSYTNDVVPAVQKFKFHHFGHDVVILHSHEIRKEICTSGNRRYWRHYSLYHLPFLSIAKSIRKLIYGSIQPFFSALVANHILCDVTRTALRESTSIKQTSTDGRC